MGTGWWLLEPAPAVVRWAAVAVALLLCVVAVIVRGRRAVAALLAAELVAPAVAAVSLVVDGYGALDMPFESAATRRVTQTTIAESFAEGPKLVALAHKLFPGAHYPILADTGILASPFIFTTGAEVPAFGGFTGSAPAMSTADLARLTAPGRIGFALITAGDDDRDRWIRQHCAKLPSKSGDSVLAYACGKAGPR